MKSISCFLVLLAWSVAGFGLAGSAYAQGTATDSENFTVQIDVRNPASCSISPISALNFGVVYRPTSGTATANGSTTATVSYSNSSNVTGSLNPTNFTWDSGRISVSLSATRGSFTAGSGTVNFTISGTATVQSTATPQAYSRNVSFSVTCSPQ